MVYYQENYKLKEKQKSFIHQFSSISYLLLKLKDKITNEIFDIFASLCHEMQDSNCKVELLKQIILQPEIWMNCNVEITKYAIENWKNCLKL